MQHNAELLTNLDAVQMMPIIDGALDCIITKLADLGGNPMDALGALGMINAIVVRHVERQDVPRGVALALLKTGLDLGLQSLDDQPADDGSAAPAGDAVP